MNALLCTCLTLGGLVCFPVTAAPALTARPFAGRVSLGSFEAEPAWASAETLLLPAVSELRVHPQPMIQAQALVNDDTLFLRLEWPDRQADRTYRPWRHTEGGWERLETEDDAVQIIIHGADHAFDLWDWSAHRSGAVGHARDSSGPPNAVDSREFPDEGQGTCRPNGVDEPEATWASPETGPGGRTMHVASALFEDRLTPLAEAGPVEAGQTIPSIISTFPTGSAADVRAGAAWRDGRWVLELRRALDTGDGERDVKLTPGQAHTVSISFHTADPPLEPVELILQVPEPAAD